MINDNTIRQKERMPSYLHANTRSALWLGPTYLYSAKASQTTFRKISLITTTVVRLLYNSNGTLLLLSSFPETNCLPSSVLSKQVPLRKAYSFSVCPIEASEPDFSCPSRILINSNTLWLICQRKSYPV